MPSTTAPRSPRTTREQVLDHAATLIRERGFRATSIGDLLERAGVQKGSFYYYFPTKEDLGHAVLDRWIEDLRIRLIQYLLDPQGPPPLERVAAALDGFLTEQESTGCRGGCPFGNLASELADVHEGFRTRISEAFRDLSKAFADLLERAKADGDLRPETDTTSLGEFLVASIEGGILLAKVHKAPDALVAALRGAEAHVATHRTRAE